MTTQADALGDVGGFELGLAGWETGDAGGALVGVGFGEGFGDGFGDGLGEAGGDVIV